MDIHMLGYDRPSPKNRLTGVSIVDGVLTVPLPSGSSLTDVQDTNSMDPASDIGSKNLLAPANPDDIQAGDIVLANKPGAPFAILHRVIRIGSDKDGRYFVTRGDNVCGLVALLFFSFFPFGEALSTERWRDSEIKAVVVGILY